MSKEERTTNEMKELVDQLNEFKNEEKKLFSLDKSKDGDIKAIFVNLRGSFELHHGNKIIDEGMQPASIVQKYLEL